MSAERCGPYTVERDGPAVVVTCPCCGAHRLPVDRALRLASRLRGPFGRFESNAGRPERLRLADAIEAATA